MKRAVIYARYSSRGQREESIEGQERECLKYCEQKGYTVVDRYFDRACTGTNDNRQRFQDMINDAHSGKFDVVICWKHDRFARNRYIAECYKRKLAEHNVSVEYVMEPIEKNAQGVIVDALFEGLSEYYSLNLSENVKRGLLDSARKRLAIGQHCYGLTKGEDGRFAHDPEQAPVVKRIFDEFASGVSATSIAEDLNKEGYLTRYRKPFTCQAVTKIIKNPKYKGLYQYGSIYDEEGIPPIVEKELWQKCNDKITTHKVAPRIGTGSYLLAGKLFCGHCGELMTSASGTSKTGRVYKYYICKNAKKKNCEKRKVDKEFIEKEITDLMILIIHSDKAIEMLADKVVAYQKKHSDQSRAAVLRNKIKESERILDKFCDAIIDGANVKMLNPKIDAEVARKEALEAELAEEERRESDTVTKEDVVNYMQAMRRADYDDDDWRTYIVYKFLRAAYLYDDGKIILHLNTIDGDTVCGFDLLKDYEADESSVLSSEESSVLSSSAPPRAYKSNTYITVICGQLFAIIEKSP